MRRKRGWTALVAGLAAMCLVLAGCGGGKKASSGTSSASKVEVFSWWTGGGEAKGLEAMVADFKKKHPEITFENAAVAGGSGTNAKAVLASRLQAHQPPDSFQGHAGAELLDYIKAGQLEPLDFLYDQLKLRDVFPQELVNQITFEGHVYSVPVNIHRANVLWFSPSVLKEAGISKPPADWSSPQVTKALQDYNTILQYTNTEAASTDWQGAAKDVVDGKAAFNIMGDWAAGYFKELNKQP